MTLLLASSFPHLQSKYSMPAYSSEFPIDTSDLRGPKINFFSLPSVSKHAPSPVSLSSLLRKHTALFQLYSTYFTIFQMSNVLHLNVYQNFHQFPPPLLLPSQSKLNHLLLDYLHRFQSPASIFHALEGVLQQHSEQGY